MSNRHSARSTITGRFTTSGAPIPDEAGMGDASAESHVLSPSANPQSEHDEPIGTVYSARDLTHGGFQRPIQHRRQILIDSRTGQELSDHIADVRGAERLIGGHRTDVHLAAANGDPFIESLMGPSIGPETRSYRRVPGSGSTRLPTMYGNQGRREDDDDER